MAADDTGQPEDPGPDGRYSLERVP